MELLSHRVLAYHLQQLELKIFHSAWADLRVYWQNMNVAVAPHPCHYK